MAREHQHSLSRGAELDAWVPQGFGQRALAESAFPLTGLVPI